MIKLDLSIFYSKRLLVFLEDEPQSNKYRQVILDGAHFKAVSDAVCGGPAKTDNDLCYIKMSDEIYSLPDLVEIENEKAPD